MAEGVCEMGGRGVNLPNIITGYNVPENLIEIPQVVQKSRRRFLVTKKLMTSASNRCSHHFFTFNIL